MALEFFSTKVTKKSVVIDNPPIPKRILPAISLTEVAVDQTLQSDGRIKLTASLDSWQAVEGLKRACAVKAGQKLSAPVLVGGNGQWEDAPHAAEKLVDGFALICSYPPMTESLTRIDLVLDQSIKAQLAEARVRWWRNGSGW